VARVGAVRHAHMSTVLSDCATLEEIASDAL